MSFKLMTKVTVFLSIFAVLVFAGSCNPSPTESDPKPTVPPGVSFSIIQRTDTIMAVRVQWNAVNDAYGPADYYLHTATATKLITDSTTGPLPTLKQVSGLVDTFRFRINLVNDTVTITSQVWSVRRGLQSTTPGIGRLFVRKGDVPPPPPDSVRVDTLIIAMVWGGPGLSYSICCGQNPAGPWVDTINFNRLYHNNPGAPYVGAGDTVFHEPNWGDTVVVSGYRHPLMKFRFNPPNALALAVDSNTAAFRVLPTYANQYAWIVATYSDTWKDSLRVYVSATGGYCGPWPDCYYNPQLYAPQMPELPRVYIDIPPYPAPPPPSPALSSLKNLKIALQ